eukprot:2789562-Rhodomonas_salina.3
MRVADQRKQQVRVQIKCEWPRVPYTLYGNCLCEAHARLLMLASSVPHTYASHTLAQYRTPHAEYDHHTPAR